MKKKDKKTNKKRLIISFGSQVSGRANALSDFDFAVLEEKPLSLSKMTQISHYLAKKLKINEEKMDLVDLSTASPLLLYEVAQKGKLVEGNDFDFIRFKVRAWKIYLDTAKFRRLGEKAVKKYVKGIRLQKN
jgi:predicted nucleotidyltransferase